MLSALTFLLACGGNGVSVGSSGSVSVSASPSNAVVVSGRTKQFTAVVSNTRNKKVTWSATQGYINSSGLFTAPTSFSTIRVKVTATSQADSTKSATVSLIIDPPSTDSVLTISPATVNFSQQVGNSDEKSAGISVTNGGSGHLAFTGASDQAWLFLPRSSGITPVTLQINASIRGLTAGTYTGHVALTGGGLTKVVTVILTISRAPVQHSVALTWKDTLASDVMSYSLYRSTTSGGSYGLVASAILGVSYIDQSVEPGTIYYYVVNAVDNQGQESSPSNESRVDIP
jgi:hypothetical protein